MWRKTRGSLNHFCWSCKWCGKKYMGGPKRLLQHLSQMGGQVTPCECPWWHIAKIRGGATNRVAASITHEEVCSPVETSSPDASTFTSISTSGFSKRARFKPHRQPTRHATLAKAMASVGGSFTSSKSDHALLIRRLHTPLLCAISPLIARKWLMREEGERHRTCRLDRCLQNNMRTKNTDEENGRIDQALNPTWVA